MKVRVVSAAVPMAVLALAAAGSAEVTDRSPSGFTVKATVDVAAPPEAVYVSLVRHVDEWWDPVHTYSGEAKNLSIIAEPGGCFCETLPRSGGVEHAIVVNVQPGQLLRMRGAFGPLQGAGVAGSLTWQFEKTAAGSRVVFTYVVGGYYPGGLDAVAGAVDTVLVGQLTRLKGHAERTAGGR